MVWFEFEESERGEKVFLINLESYLKERFGSGSSSERQQNGERSPFARKTHLSVLARVEAELRDPDN